jgi:AcrR family transcriptional regulator
MNAAQRRFLAHGVSETTIDQITSAAGVAKGTFYLYFSSKEDIRAALGERFAQQLLLKIKTAVAAKEKDDWKGKLETWAAAGLAGYLDQMRLHDILFYGSHSPTREGLVDNIVIDHLGDLLQAGVDAGAWAIDDPHFTAVFLFSGLHGVVDSAYTKEKRVNRSRLANRLQRLCLRAAGIVH